MFLEYIRLNDWCQINWLLRLSVVLHHLKKFKCHSFLSWLTSDHCLDSHVFPEGRHPIFSGALIHKSPSRLPSRLPMAILVQCFLFHRDTTPSESCRRVKHSSVEIWKSWITVSIFGYLYPREIVTQSLEIHWEEWLKLSLFLSTDF